MKTGQVKKQEESASGLLSNISTVEKYFDLQKIITLDQSNPRFDLKLEALYASIENEGLINPPLGIERENGIEIIQGNRRIHVCRLLFTKKPDIFALRFPNGIPIRLIDPQTDNITVTRLRLDHGSVLSLSKSEVFASLVEGAKNGLTDRENILKHYPLLKTFAKKDTTSKLDQAEKDQSPIEFCNTLKRTYQGLLQDINLVAKLGRKFQLAYIFQYGYYASSWDKESWGAFHRVPDTAWSELSKLVNKIPSSYKGAVDNHPSIELWWADFTTGKLSEKKKPSSQNDTIADRMKAIKVAFAQYPVLVSILDYIQDGKEKPDIEAIKAMFDRFNQVPIVKEKHLTE